MFLQSEEKAKHNQNAKLFLAKMTMLVMIKLREKEAVKDTLLPVPKDLDSINEQNKILYSVINNIIKNELKLDDIGDKEIRFAETSYLNDVDSLKIINSSIDNSDISGALADRLLYDIDYIKNTVIATIKKLSAKVTVAKAKYESNRNANTFSLVPVGIPSIIEYFEAKGDFLKLEENPIQIPVRTGNQNEYLNFDELTDKDLRSQLLAYYNFNQDDMYDFLSSFNEGEILVIARNYLTILNDSNEYLKFLNAAATSNHSKLYLVYLISAMLLDTVYQDNAPLRIVNNSCKVMIARSNKLIKEYVAKNIVTTFVDKDKIYVLEDLFVNNEIDTTAIVGGVIAANVKDNIGSVLLTLDTINENTEAFKMAYNQFRVARDVEIETGMKQAMINIYALESKNLLDELEEDVNISKLGMLAVVNEYVSKLDFKSATDIENVSQAIVLNHIYPSEVAKKFIEYFNTYSIMNSNLTSQDCALLAGASIVVIELGSNIVLE